MSSFVKAMMTAIVLLFKKIFYLKVREDSFPSLMRNKSKTLSNYGGEITVISRSQET